MNQFGFDRCVEAFDNSVVPTIAFATHAAPNTVITEKPSVCSSGVLAPAIGVVQHATRRLTPQERHAQCIEDEIFGHAGLRPDKCVISAATI
jgi:hypothetical protein